VCGLEHLSEHSTGTGYHKVTREYRVTRSIYPVGSLLRTSLVRSVYNIILKQTGIVSNFDAGREGFHLIIEFSLFKRNFIIVRRIGTVVNRARQHEEDG